MLPSSLTSVYQQYKAETNLIANWLATTARLNGYSAAVAGQTANAPKPARLKGKARLLAKAADAGKAGHAQSAVKVKHVLHVNEYEPIAAFLATIDTLEVPRYFAVALERVIWGSFLHFCTFALFALFTTSSGMTLTFFPRHPISAQDICRATGIPWRQGRIGG